MRVQLKSNGNAFDIKKSDFDKFSKDQKKNYTILSKEDVAEAVTENIADKKTDKKVDATKAAEPTEKK